MLKVDCVNNVKKRKYFLGRAGVMAGLCLCLAFMGCGNEVKSDTEQVPAQQEQKTEAQVNENSAGEKEPAVLPYAVAKDDFSNLQLDKPDIAVYDKHTLAERRKQGLTTAMPAISPYREGKTAYLTFDDGPDNKNTLEILDILAKNNVKATFYVLGRNAKLYPQTVERMFKEGHAIGNHSYDHDYGRLYPSSDNFLAEMEETDEVLHEIIGMRPLIVRAPGGRIGNFTAAYERMLEENGYVEHDWNVSSADAAPNHPVARDFIDNIDSQTDDGKESAIILMHCSEGHEETVAALPEIIRILKEKGYQFGVITPMTPQPW